MNQPSPPPVPPRGSGAGSQGFVGPGVLRWENPAGEEPDFVATLREHPERWGVVFEGSGADWSRHPNLKWLLDGENTTIEYKWVQVGKDGTPLRSSLLQIRIEMQRWGIAYARYIKPESTKTPQG